MCDKKGIYSLSCNPYGGKLRMGKDGENLCVLAYSSFRAILSVY